jgi:hypothetical protein
LNRASIPTPATLTSPRQTRTGNNSKHRKNSQMTDPTHNNAVNTKATFPDEHDETSSFISLYMDNTPGMYAKYSQTTEVCNQTPQVVNEPLTEELIKEHLHADHTSDLIAVPTLNLQDNTGRFVMIDIHYCEDDFGEPIAAESDSEGSYFSTHEQAIHINYMLLLNGIKPILSESPGGDRYQIWVVFDKPMPVSQLIRFGDTILACCRHRIPTSNFFLHRRKDCTFHGVTSCRDILTNDISIEVHPSSQHLHSQTTNDFVPLPCIHKDSFHYMDGYSELDHKGQRMYMVGMDATDNYFELNLNSPSGLNPKHFVYEPVMTSVEFNQGQFAKSGKPIDKVLARLKGVQPCENGYVACCPAHIDFTRSLLVSEHETGDVHLSCSKGCSIEYILKSLDPFTRDWLLHVNRPRSSGNTRGKTKLFATSIPSQ